MPAGHRVKPHQRRLGKLIYEGVGVPRERTARAKSLRQESPWRVRGTARRLCSWRSEGEKWEVMPGSQGSWAVAQARSFEQVSGMVI